MKNFNNLRLTFYAIPRLNFNSIMLNDGSAFAFPRIHCLFLIDYSITNMTKWFTYSNHLFYTILNNTFFIFSRPVLCTNTVRCTALWERGTVQTDFQWIHLYLSRHKVRWQTMPPKAPAMCWNSETLQWSWYLPWWW